MRSELESIVRTFLKTHTRPQQKVLFAYSGGLDSSVLLSLLAQFREEFSIRLTAIHIDHQLQSSSNIFSMHCEKTCEKLGVVLTIKKVSLDTDSGESVEALAREARYSIFQEMLEEDALLITAHHADDQIETFLLQLLRGAGPKGLSAMGEVQDFHHNFLARPLLKVSRAVLESYAKEKHISFIEDPTNQSERFDRNFLRRQIIPLLKNRWPATLQAITRSIEHIATEHTVLSDLLSKDLEKIRKNNSLELSALLELDTQVMKLLIRNWITENNYKLPSTKILTEISHQFESYNSESNICISWDTVELRVYAGQVYLIDKINESEFEAISGSSFSSEKAIELPGGFGVLSFVLSDKSGKKLALGFRQGGEKIRCKASESRKSLKQLFNEHKVLPWMRSRIPLLFDGEELVAVGDIWVNADWLAQQKTSRFEVMWDRRPQLFA